MHHWSWCLLKILKYNWEGFSFLKSNGFCMKQQLSCLPKTTVKSWWIILMLNIPQVISAFYKLKTFFEKPTKGPLLLFDLQFLNLHQWLRSINYQSHHCNIIIKSLIPFFLFCLEGPHFTFCHLEEEGTILLQHDICLI